ncbi:MAG: polysaccharide deacetylase family protein [Bacteroidota bacterium]
MFFSKFSYKTPGLNSKFSLFVFSILLVFPTCKQTTYLINNPNKHVEYEMGAIVRGDTLKRSLSLVFTGDEYADGAEHISEVLKMQQIKAAFFFTGNFYRNTEFEDDIKKLIADGHYLGAHSDRHLLYCDWKKRDSLLLSRKEFIKDLGNNYLEMKKFGIDKEDAPYFLPPYEWYNDSISSWTSGFGLQTINFSKGTRSHADYTTPKMSNYLSSEKIYQSIVDYEAKNLNGLNGFILLIHIGTDPDRKDKFYYRIEELIIYLKNKGYQFRTLKELLKNS